MPEVALRDALPGVALGHVTKKSSKLLEAAKALPVEERADLAAELLATLPAEIAEELHSEWAAELERRARRAWDDPDGGEPWDTIERRLLARNG